MKQGGFHAQSSRSSSGLAMAVLCIAACLAYANSFSAPFIFDGTTITENPGIRTGWPPWSILRGRDSNNARPLVVYTFVLNYRLGGYDVWGYHAVNLAVHVLAAWTLFGVLRRTFANPRLPDRYRSSSTALAFAVALLWTLHPLQTQSVTYIYQRFESMMGLMFLLTLYCFIRAQDSDPRHARRWLVASWACCLLGAATKEVIAMAPLLVAIYDRLFIADSWRGVARRRWKYYAALASTWLLLGGLVLANANVYMEVDRPKFTRWEYLLTQPSVIVHYLRLSVWPGGQCLDYQWPPAETAWQIVPPALLLIILFGCTVWGCIRGYAWSYLGAWFFGVLAPTSSFLPLQDAAFEHRMYLPLAAVVCAAVVIGFECLTRCRVALVRRDPIIIGAAALLAMVLGAVTFARNQLYADELAMWRDVRTTNPANKRAELWIAMRLTADQQYPAALELFEDLAKTAPQMDASPEFQNSWGLCLNGLNQRELAIPHFLKSVNADDRVPVYHLNFCTALATLGYLEAARTELISACEVSPGWVDEAGQPTPAALVLQWLASGLKMPPQTLLDKPLDMARSHFELGVALARGGEQADAVKHFSMAERLHPSENLGFEVQEAWGISLLELQQWAAAVPHFQEALRGNSQSPSLQLRLGKALLGAGRAQSAIEPLREALRLDPAMQEAQTALQTAINRSADESPTPLEHGANPPTDN